MKKISKVISHPVVVTWNTHIADWGFVFLTIGLVVLVFALSRLGCGAAKPDLQNNKSVGESRIETQRDLSKRSESNNCILILS